MAIICNSTTIKTVKVGDTEIFEVRTPSQNSLRYNKFDIKAVIYYHKGGTYTSSYQSIAYSSLNKASEVELVVFYADKDGNITELDRTTTDGGERSFILPKGSHNQAPVYSVGVGYSCYGIDHEGITFENVKWSESRDSGWVTCYV